MLYIPKQECVISSRMRTDRLLTVCLPGRGCIHWGVGVHPHGGGASSGLTGGGGASRGGGQL